MLVACWWRGQCMLFGKKPAGRVARSSQESRSAEQRLCFRPSPCRVGFHGGAPIDCGGDILDCGVHPRQVTGFGLPH